MFPENNLSTQKGIGLPAAIFVVTILALILATMANIQRSGSEGVSLQVQSARAFYTAESGIQIALNLLLPPNGSAGLACTTSFYSWSYTEAGIANCSVAVSCSSVTVGSDDYYTLRSIGICGDGVDQARREIEVRAK